VGARSVCQRFTLPVSSISTVLPRSLPRWRAWGTLTGVAARGRELRRSVRRRLQRTSKSTSRNWALSSIPTRGRVESAVFHDIEAGYEFGVGLSLRAAITTSPTRIRHLSRTNRTPTPTQPHTRCWGAPTSSSCALHFGSSLGGCRHEARLRLEPREFRLNRLPE